MKKIYFCATNGTTLIYGQLPYATKEAIESCSKMFDMIDELHLDLNMAICATKKEVTKLSKEWGFKE